MQNAGEHISVVWPNNIKTQSPCCRRRRRSTPCAENARGRSVDQALRRVLAVIRCPSKRVKARFCLSVRMARARARRSTRSRATAPDGGIDRFAGAEIAGLAAHTICRQGIARTFQIPRRFASRCARTSRSPPVRRGRRNLAGRSTTSRGGALGLVGLLTDATATTDGSRRGALKKSSCPRARYQAAALLADESLWPRLDRDGARRRLTKHPQPPGVTIIWVEHIWAC
jgi:hypothetical protein